MISRRNRAGSILLASAAVLVTGQLMADTFTWTQTTVPGTFNWQDATWTKNAGTGLHLLPSVQGDIANFGSLGAAASTQVQTINLNANRMVGQLLFSNTSANTSYTFGNGTGTGNRLQMDNGGVPATIRNTGTRGTTYNVPVEVYGTLNVQGLGNGTGTSLSGGVYGDANEVLNLSTYVNSTVTLGGTSNFSGTINILPGRRDPGGFVRIQDISYFNNAAAINLQSSYLVLNNISPNDTQIAKLTVGQRSTLEFGGSGSLVNVSNPSALLTRFGTINLNGSNQFKDTADITLDQYIVSVSTHNEVIKSLTVKGISTLGLGTAGRTMTINGPLTLDAATGGVLRMRSNANAISINNATVGFDTFSVVDSASAAYTLASPRIFSPYNAGGEGTGGGEFLRVNGSSGAYSLIPMTASDYTAYTSAAVNQVGLFNTGGALGANYTVAAAKFTAATAITGANTITSRSGGFLFPTAIGSGTSHSIGLIANDGTNNVDASLVFAQGSAAMATSGQVTARNLYVTTATTFTNADFNSPLNLSGTEVFMAAVDASTVRIGSNTGYAGKHLNVSTLGSGKIQTPSALTIGGLRGAGWLSPNSATSNLTIDAADNSTFEGVIVKDGSNNINVTKTGGGSQTFANTSYYTGTTAVNGGTLVANGKIAPGLSTTGAGNSDGSYRYYTLDSGSTAGIAAGQFVRVGSSYGYVTAILSDTTFQTNFNNAAAAGSAIQFYGGSATGSGSVTIGASGTLAGSGGILGGVTVDGTIAPGNSAGTLALGSGLLLNSGATLAYELSGSSQTVGGGVNDLISITGNLTLDGTLNVTALNSFASVADSTRWTLITYTGALTNNGLNIGTMPTGPASWVVDTSIPGKVDLVAVVPEPTVVMMGLGVSLAALARRRVRKADAE